MTARPSEQPVPTCSPPAASSSSRAAEDAHGLPRDSYTAQRLENASPEHLHATSRRFFIGPLPRGWLQRRRRSWYKAFFGFRNYSSHAPTFSALDVSLGRSSASSPPALYRQSFPQPDDVDFEDVSEEEEEGEGEGQGGGGDGAMSQDDGGGVVGTTTTTTTGTTTQSTPAAQGQPESDADQKPSRSWGTTTKEKKEEPPGGNKRVSFPDESDLSLRPSSSRDGRETFYTAPESKLQTDGLSGLSPIPSAAPDGPQSRRPPAALKGSSGLPGPSVSVVPEEPESEENHSLAPTSNGTAPTPTDVGSQASLLPHDSPDADAAAAEPAERPEASTRDLREEEPRAQEDNEVDQGQEPGQDTSHGVPSTESEENVGKRLESRVLSRIASFRLGVEDNLMDRRRRLSTRFSRGQPQDSAAQREQQHSACRDGEIIRAERMLVKLDVTEQSVPDDFSENESLKIVSRPIENWREYLVVCRRASNSNEPTAPALLQLFKTRVITQVRAPQVKKRCSHEILLARGRTHANLFSGLDKTIVLWHPYKQQQTRIVILRAASAAHSVEWYTFIRDTLGRKQPSTLMVYVPDLRVSLRLKNPFVLLAAAQKSREESHQDGCRGGGCDDDGDDDDDDGGTTPNPDLCVAPLIVNTCLNTLQECPQFATVLDLWTRSEKMGLAWRRYDRLEWVQGANEQRMYGMQSMQNSHELELRPRQHYPTTTEAAGGDHPSPMHEPPPVEGFMILLTSQRGANRRWGKMFYRRLYFYTEDQYLCFCRPARAKPPNPPRIATICGERVPRTSNIARESPLVYPVEPFPLEGGEIPWLNVDRGRRKAYVHRRDAEAYAEVRRNVANLTHAEGYISLCRLSDVRPARPSSSSSGRRHSSTDHTGNSSGPRNEGTEHSNGGDVDFHGEAAARRNNNNRGGSGGEAARRILSGSATRPRVKSNRTLELVLDDGLVVQLRTYNQETRDEWVKRLREMMVYWKARTRDDTFRLKAVRQRNLDRLDIDEEQESMLGQLAQKWEVSKAEASPELFNTCGLSGCRAIKMSGQLYRKTRRRAPFVKISVVLMEGRLLLFQGSVRKSSGAQRQHTHHERKSVVDLNDCYVYSGILTGNDQLYPTQKPFGNRLPGHYSTPRIYLSDGWTSTDEDTATCFVVWRGARKSLFRGDEEAARWGKAKIKWRQVRALGVPGKSIVFKTRSRAERDLWVLAIQTEIDRMQHEEDLRLVRRT